MACTVILIFMVNAVDFEKIDGTPSVPQMDDCDELWLEAIFGLWE